MDETLKKEIFVTDLVEGRELASAFLVLSLSRGQTSRGSIYLNLEMGDRTGRVGAKVWDGAESLASCLALGSVVWVRGYVDTYRGALQLVVREARPLPEEEVHWPDYLKASTKNILRMKAELRDLIAGIQDGDYRSLVIKVLEDPEVAELFFSQPAAKNFHHAYLHGLLEHSLSVARLARFVGGLYGDKLSADLLLAGAVLHDLGKIWEFTPLPRLDYSRVGRLVGHLALGAEYLGRLAGPDFPRYKLELLQHLILSHHGEHEFGSPVRPQTLEAVALHHLDNLDAKLEAVSAFIADEADQETGWTGFHRLLGNPFYRTPASIIQAPAVSETAAEEPKQPLTDTEEENDPLKTNAVQEGDSSQDAGRLF